jgi:bifunctional non-homologous end joining protein LigD
VTARKKPLAEYARKRDFAATPEPSDRPKPKRGASKDTLRFVIQKHRATRVHYDFRLEAGGVLASWAIPKGPALDPAEKRLAMHVEDHPYDYRDFEGIIPKGNYGAGDVIVWDRGTYRLAEGTDPVAEIAKGKIKFIMAGTKMRGMFTLVKIKKHAEGESGEPWLLIKDHDDFVDPSYDVEEHPESVKSGKTNDEIAGDVKVKAWISNRPSADAVDATKTAAKKTTATKTVATKASTSKTPALKATATKTSAKKLASKKRAAHAQPMPHVTSPMLATAVDAPFDDDAWLFEVKWDGYRALVTVHEDGTVEAASRNGNDLLKRFADLRDIGAAFTSLPVLVDGEACALDANGVSSFERLTAGDPVTFVAFDCLYAGGRDLRELPLEERKAELARIVVTNRGVLVSDHVIGTGKALFALAEQRGLEGIIAKKRDSTYRSARTQTWKKIKAQHAQEFAVGGWTEPRAGRKGFGALLLGYYDGDAFTYVGSVGSGFDANDLSAITKTLRAAEIDTSPFTTKPKTATTAHFVEPRLVAQVRFTEWTRDGSLRHPVFLGFRDDKAARDVGREP